jgi:hypothetical protein
MILPPRDAGRPLDDMKNSRQELDEMLGFPPSDSSAAGHAEFICFLP